MSNLDKMPREEIEKAQDKLGKLCKKFDVKEFSILDGVGLVGWQKLVQAMCGIDINDGEKPGRKAYPKEFILDVGSRIDAYRDFTRFDNQKLEEEGVLEEIGGTLMRKIAFSEVATEIRTKTGEEYTDDQIRGIYDDYRKLRKEELRDLENYPADPDELFYNMK
ncbi:MAG: hypothetical protein AB7E52_03005 [Bdellovibrionales bacterium]